MEINTPLYSRGTTNIFTLNSLGRELIETAILSGEELVFTVDTDLVETCMNMGKPNPNLTNPKKFIFRHLDTEPLAKLFRYLKDHGMHVESERYQPAALAEPDFEEITRQMLARIGGKI